PEAFPPRTFRVNCKRILFFSLLALGVAFGLWVSHPLYLAWLGGFLIQSETPIQADAILVLGGDNLRDERLLHAVGLWRSGVARQIVLSAVLADWQATEDYAGWRHAMKLNLPAGVVVLA